MIREAICYLFGHRFGVLHTERWVSHWGQERTRKCYGCTRCRSEYPCEEGLFSRLAHRFREWRETICNDCDKPKVKFGRAVGDHSSCEELPF